MQSERNWIFAFARMSRKTFLLVPAESRNTCQFKLKEKPILISPITSLERCVYLRVFPQDLIAKGWPRIML